MTGHPTEGTLGVNCRSATLSSFIGSPDLLTTEVSSHLFRHTSPSFGPFTGWRPLRGDATMIGVAADLQSDAELAPNWAHPLRQTLLGVSGCARRRVIRNLGPNSCML